MKQITEEQFKEIVASTIADLIKDDEIPSDVKMALMLTGIMVGRRISEKLFENDSQIEII